MMVAMIVAVNATFSVFRKAWSTAVSWSRSPYQWVVNPVQWVPLRVRLKLKTIRPTIGANRNANTSTAWSFR